MRSKIAQYAYFAVYSKKTAKKLLIKNLFGSLPISGHTCYFIFIITDLHYPVYLASNFIF